MLGDVDGSAGLEHPDDLLQGGVDVRDRAEGEGDEDRVDRVVGEVESLAVEPGPRHRRRGLDAALRRHVPSAVGRLDRQDVGDRLRVQRAVQPRPEAELKDRALQTGAGTFAQRMDVLRAAGDVDDVRQQPVFPETHGLSAYLRDPILDGAPS